ncbi:MAG TPA: cation:proton antiporter subunit C [Hyphomonadaceae bacterium]|nr:cation:proton antiporter subunit C [Hyphomonadaceae bacterium]
MSLLAHLNYFAVVLLMMAGLYVVFSSRNLIRRMIGLALFQSSTGLFYISLAKVTGGTAPIRIEPDSATARELASRLDPGYAAQVAVDGVVYSNPLPHVLIRTAIVVGVATLAVGVAIAARVREAYGTVDAGEIAEIDRKTAQEPAP